MCSRDLADRLAQECGDIMQIFQSAGRLGQGTYGVVYKVKHNTKVLQLGNSPSVHDSMPQREPCLRSKMAFEDRLQHNSDASKSSIPPASLPAIGSFRNQSVKSIMNSSNLPANVSNSSFTYEQYSAEPSKKAKTLDPSGLTSQLPTGSCPRYDDGDLGMTRWYALKGMQATTPNSLDISVPTLREFSLLRELEHKNVVMIKDVFLRPKMNPRQIWILFEYISFDLWCLLSKRRRELHKPFPPEAQRCIMYQLMCGMEYLHSHWILHRDLKPGNILITSKFDPSPGVVKLADFGLARLNILPPRPLSKVDPIVVTYWYRAPELLLGTMHYTRAIDMWALGCIMAELVNLKPLFHVQEDQAGKNPYFQKQLQAIASVLGVATDDAWPTLNLMPEYKSYRRDFRNSSRFRFSLLHVVKDQEPASSFHQLLQNLLVYDPMKRLTAKEAVRHPYFSEKPFPMKYVNMPSRH
eukprot:gene2386-5333_t